MQISAIPKAAALGKFDLQCSAAIDVNDCTMYASHQNQFCSCGDMDMQLAERDSRSAMRRGFALKCPNCGKGHVLHNYLKVNDTCEVCGLDLTCARADDGPAYLTILIVGHLAGFALHIIWSIWEPTPMVLASVTSLGAVALSLFLLPRIKGAMIGFQWAKHMHGF